MQRRDRGPLVTDKRELSRRFELLFAASVSGNAPNSLLATLYVRFILTCNPIKNWEKWGEGCKRHELVALNEVSDILHNLSRVPLEFTEVYKILGAADPKSAIFSGYEEMPIVQQAFMDTLSLDKAIQKHCRHSAGSWNNPFR